MALACRHSALIIGPLHLSSVQLLDLKFATPTGTWLMSQRAMSTAEAEAV